MSGTQGADRPPKAKPIMAPTGVEPIMDREPVLGDEPPRAANRTDWKREAELPAPQPTAPVHLWESRDTRQIADLLQRGTRLTLMAAVFLVAVVVDPRTVDAFNLVKVTALWVMAVVAGGLWSAGLLLRRSLGQPASFGLPRSWIVRLSLAVLGVVTLATLLSSARALSFFGLYHRYEGWISVALYVFVLLLIVAVYHRRPAALREIVAAIGTAAAVVSAYVVLQRMGIDFASWQQVSGAPTRYPIGTLGNSALTGAYLGVCVPFVVYLTVTARSWARRAPWIGACALVVLGIAFTQSRSGIIAAVFGVAAMALFMQTRLQPWHKAAAIAAGLLVLNLAPLFLPNVVGPRAPAGLSVGGGEMSKYRVHMWEGAWRMTVDRPILGWGPETFYGVYPRFRSATEAKTQGLGITDKPHNIWLGWTTATGFIGLVAYVALVGAALWLFFLSLGKFGKAHQYLALCFGGGLVAYLAQGSHSVDVPPLALMGWISLAGVAVLLERRPESDDAAPALEAERPRWRPPVKPRTIAAYGVTGLVVIVLVAIGVRPLRADHSAWAGEQRTAAGWSEETMRLYEKAASLNPFEAAYKGLAAFYLERVAGNQAAPFRFEEALRRAVRLYEGAHRLQPDNVFFMINAARVYARLGSSGDPRYFTAGDRWLGRAVTLDPLDPQLRDLYADLLGQWGSNIQEDSARREILNRARTQSGIARRLRVTS